MSDSCIECGKELKGIEKTEGFCSYCLAKINNDFRILDETYEEREISVDK